MPSELLIIDDDPLVAQTLSQQLSALGYAVNIAEDAKKGNRAVRDREFQLVLLDLALPDMTGLELLKLWQEDPVQAPVVMISGTATIPEAVQALKFGAQDFLVKPIDMQLLDATIKRVLAQSQLRKENTRLRQLVRSDEVTFLGESAAVKAMLKEATMIARGDQPVLLEGETGTGKQVLAKFIHAASERAQEPFVSVNCAALAENLFESELFGHEKGAFTGAIARKPGKLELVGKGTLFLDEIGELPMQCQAKLLTAVEDRTFERVGGLQTLRFEGRILAATNRDLDAEIKKGGFRRDLFYRLTTFHFRLPPLRTRPDDIAIYLGNALALSGRKYGRKFDMPDAAILDAMAKYPWPGNVRELYHHVERISLLCETPQIPKRLWLSFPASEQTVEAEQTDLQEALGAYKKRHILGVLTQCDGNQTEAAKRLGIERTHLNRLIAEYEGRR